MRYGARPRNICFTCTGRGCSRIGKFLPPILSKGPRGVRRHTRFGLERQLLPSVGWPLLLFWPPTAASCCFVCSFLLSPVPLQVLTSPFLCTVAANAAAPLLRSMVI
ncbi:unnamed protein product [Prorocentrum cordatum]|uniref:Uncharacterized protein n=1 Tax=Prorocentrum cordatum TaxID=2364126 RepID=A0ABN9S3B4_9DINO|nr:unnamed protein product [Polarella glacialis]